MSQNSLVPTKPTANLPSFPLPKPCQDQVWRHLRAGYSDKDALKLATLPQDQLLTAIELRLSFWNNPLTEQECKDCLRLLALAGLPRSAIDESDAPDVHKLYWSIFVKAGVTFAMLKSVCEKLIAQETKRSETKFFPDPGGLISLCRDDLSEKALKVASLEKARQRLLELNGGASMEAPLVQPGKLKSIGEILAKHGKDNPLWPKREPSEGAKGVD